MLMEDPNLFRQRSKGKTCLLINRGKIPGLPRGVEARIAPAGSGVNQRRGRFKRRSGVEWLHTTARTRLVRRVRVSPNVARPGLYRPRRSPVLGTSRRCPRLSGRIHESLARLFCAIAAVAALKLGPPSPKTVGTSFMAEVRLQTPASQNSRWRSLLKPRSCHALGKRARWTSGRCC